MSSRSRSGSRLSICAGLVVRNEAPYLRYLLPELARQEIDVAIIDNGSTDASPQLYAEFSGRPVISVEHLPFRGFASLVDRLAAKRVLFEKCPHAWLVHHDADEILEHHETGLTLRDAIEEVDAKGYNALNFEEFVFLPEPGSDYVNRDYRREMRRYYFFEPGKHRLNRAWKNVPGISNFTSGGHQLRGEDLRFAPESHVLRHYIVLSQPHALRKYLHRTYDPRDIQMGWQRNRLHFTVENLTIPEHSDFLQELADPLLSGVSRARPTPKHFWEWAPAPRVKA
jgi:hypothetical protein